MTDNAITWRTLVSMEPGLEVLRVEASELDDAHPRFCANGHWFAPGGIRARLQTLIGSERLPGGDRERDAVLRSEAAYLVAHDAVYAAIPDCRGCGCR